jgi:DNA-binding MarR family transcriptional regulator
MARACLSMNLRKTERLVTRHYDSYLADAGVTAVQLPLLAIIAAAEEPTFRLLSEQMELDRSTLSRNLSLLEREGLLEIGPSSGPKPGRLSLTRKGRGARAKASRRWNEAHQALMDAVSADELKGGLSFLKHLRQRTRGMSD